MLKQIQRHGKCLWVACRVAEVETRLRERSPQGLIVSIQDCDSVATARQIEAFAMRLT